MPALFGRTITEDDGRPGAPPVFVLSYKTWLKNYNGDMGVLNRSFVLNGVPTTLIGIMPPRFTKRGADLWRPVALDRADAEVSRRYFSFKGRPLLPASR